MKAIGLVGMVLGCAGCGFSGINGSIGPLVTDVAPGQGGVTVVKCMIEIDQGGVLEGKPKDCKKTFVPVYSVEPAEPGKPEKPEPRKK